MNLFRAPLFFAPIVLMGLSAFCPAAEGANQPPPEEILHVSLSFSTADGEVVLPGGIVRVQPARLDVPYEQIRARCLQVVSNFKSSDPVKRDAAIRLVAAQFNQSPKSKYGLLYQAFMFWSSKNLWGGSDSQEERDEFRTAVEDLISARTPENARSVGGALNALLDLELPFFPGDSNAEMLQRWRMTRAYGRLTRKFQGLPAPRSGLLPAWYY